ncbi:uncharacterized protein [Venturia canescens]|uniref:uncharacterized protein n=1 Tax=Venturia canescens TaxID=32260 RepID=UPI001C9D2C5F|nr:uncharacterized protein LOC122417964 [Venturia canescens]
MLANRRKMPTIAIVTCLLFESVVADFMDPGGSHSWSGLASSYGSGGYQNFGGHADNLMQESFSHSDHYQSEHQESSNYGLFDSHHGGFGHGGFGHGGGWEQHQHAHAYPISQHVEVTKPVAIPVYKNIGVPVAQPVAIKVPHPVAVGVAQPYPVHVPVAHPVAIPVVKTVAVAVVKKVPYPVEKIIPVPVEKPVPITIEKHIPVPVEKPYPIHIPIYKHVFHRPKPSHGWGR